MNESLKPLFGIAIALFGLIAFKLAIESSATTDGNERAAKAYASRLYRDYADHTTHRAGFCPDWHFNERAVSAVRQAAR